MKNYHQSRVEKELDKLADIDQPLRPLIAYSLYSLLTNINSRMPDPFGHYYFLRYHRFKSVRRVIIEVVKFHSHEVILSLTFDFDLFELSYNEVISS